MAIYEYKYKIGVSDIGKSNNINNKAILKILENAGGAHSQEIGYGINDIENTNLSWVLLDWKVKVLKRVIYNSQILVKTWARDSSRISTYRDYEIYNENGELVIIATSKWTLINIKTKKLEQLPQDMIEKYKAEEKSVFNERKINKLIEAKKYELEVEYKVKRNVIDINNHVHNLYYLDFAYEVLPEEIYKKEFNNIEIMYKKQIKLNEEILFLYTKEENKNKIAIKSKDRKTLHAIVELY